MLGTEQRIKNTLCHHTCNSYYYQQKKRAIVKLFPFLPPLATPLLIAGPSPLGKWAMPRVSANSSYASVYRRLVFLINKLIESTWRQMSRMRATSVHICVIFWYHIDVMKYYAIIIIKFQGFCESCVHHQSFVELPTVELKQESYFFILKNAVTTSVLLNTAKD